MKGDARHKLSKSRDGKLTEPRSSKLSSSLATAMTGSASRSLQLDLVRYALSHHTRAAQHSSAGSMPLFFHDTRESGCQLQPVRGQHRRVLGVKNESKMRARARGRKPPERRLRRPPCSPALAFALTHVGLVQSCSSVAQGPNSSDCSCPRCYHATHGVRSRSRVAQPEVEATRLT